MRIQPLKLIAIWSLLTIFGSAEAADLCPPTKFNVRFKREQALRTIAKEKAYTEGLIFKGGLLYESTGLAGLSEIRQIDPYTGIRQTVAHIPSPIFAQGLAVSNGEMIQLSYKDGVTMVYDNEVKLEKILPQNGEGWGLTQLNGELVKSDGSDTLTFLNPQTLATKRQIAVHDNTMKYKMLNELESAQGMILANIFGQDWIAAINPINGCVVGRISLRPLRKPETYNKQDARCYAEPCVPDDFAANGIAYDEIKDELYVTGRNWPHIYKFQFPH